MMLNCQYARTGRCKDGTWYANVEEAGRGQSSAPCGRILFLPNGIGKSGYLRSCDNGQIVHSIAIPPRLSKILLLLRKELKTTLQMGNSPEACDRLSHATIAARLHRTAGKTITADRDSMPNYVCILAKLLADAGWGDAFLDRSRSHGCRITSMFIVEDKAAAERSAPEFLQQHPR